MSNLDIKKVLFENQDLKYRDFHSKLMPTVDRNTIIGVRIPILRKIAKNLKNDENINSFLQSLPHKYYEENNLHAFVIEQIKDYDKCIMEINRFLPYVNNWATCDSLRPKCFSKNTDKLLLEIKKWLKSDYTYTVRFGIEMLMKFYLDENYNSTYLKYVSMIKSDEYYINMMIAWYFATALAKHWYDTIDYLEENKLSFWVHNKTIQKAIESYRIKDEQKVYLKSLRIKEC